MNSNYAIFDPKVDRPLHTLPRDEAKAAYDWFISQKTLRRETLLNYASGLGYELRNDETAIEALHDLFVSEIRRDGVSDAPSARVFSLCNDIGIFLAELAIENTSCLTWKMDTARKDGIYFQRPVLTGFKVKNKNYCIDFDYALCQYAHRLCRGGEIEPGLFRRMYQSALDRT